MYKSRAEQNHLSCRNVKNDLGIILIQTLYQMALRLIYSSFNVISTVKVLFPWHYVKLILLPI